MRVLLTGSTGYLGSAIASALAHHELLRERRDLRDPRTYLTDVAASDAIVHAAIAPGADRLEVDLYRLVAESGARGIFHAVTEVRRARDVFPGKGIPLDEARRELGAFADALALDQNVSASRSRAIGWQPARRWP